MRHLVWRHVFKSDHSLNPTRAELLLLVVHWTLAAVYNTVKVRTLSHASTKAARLSLLHAIPLLFPNQITFASYILDIPLRHARYLHNTLGIMAVIQGGIHCVLEGLQRRQRGDLEIPGTTVRETMYDVIVALLICCLLGWSCTCDRSGLFAGKTTLVPHLSLHPPSSDHGTCRGLVVSRGRQPSSEPHTSARRDDFVQLYMASAAVEIFLQQRENGSASASLPQSSTVSRTQSH